MNKVFKWSLIGTGSFIVAIVVLTPADSSAPLKAVQAQAPAKRVIEVTAKEMAAAFEANEAAAQAKYAEGPVRVTGIIQSIDLDFLNKPVVRLASGNPYLPTSANLTSEAQAKAQTLVKGSKLAVTCASVSEVIGAPQLSDCSF